MTPMDEILRETLHIRTAYGDLVSYVCRPGTDHDAVPLDEVLAGLDQLGDDRAAALMYAHKNVDSIDEGRALIRDIRRRLMAGRRPRTMMQVLTPEEREGVERAFRRAEERPGWFRRLWHKLP